MTGMYKLNVEEYQKIRAPQQVLDWIQHGAKLDFEQEPSPCFYQNRVFSREHADFIDSEIDRLLQVKAIRKVSTKPRCVLAMRAVPKKNGKCCIIGSTNPCRITRKEFLMKQTKMYVCTLKNLF